MSATGNVSACRPRLTRAVFVWAIVALVADIFVEWVFRHNPHGSPFLFLLPVIPLLLFVVALVRAVQKMDELQKRICLESAFIAFTLTLALSFVFAGTERAGIYHASYDALGEPMLFFWGCAYMFSVWRYR